MARIHRFLDEAARQLQVTHRVKLPFCGSWITIDYEMLDLHHEAKTPIINLTGFGSGCRGNADLTYYLSAGFQRKVFSISLPGYGNSDDPPERYYEQPNFYHEAWTLIAITRQLGIYGNCYPCCHSMASAIAAQAKALDPNFCKGLIFLGPSGFVEDNCVSLIYRFAKSGAQHRRSLTEKTLLEILNPPAEKSWFAPGRRMQRLSELNRLAAGCAYDSLIDVLRQRSFLKVLTGEYDIVSRLPSISDFAETLEGQYHNVTLGPLALQTAKKINEAILDHESRG